YEGDYPIIIKSKRKILKSNIILLCDVSGSMIDFFKESLLLSFFLKRMEKKTEIFYFSTDVKRVTNFFQVTSLNLINLRSISSTISYGSGTRIGEALQELKRRYGYYLNRRSSVVIFSDAWDLGNLELLKRELKDIKKRCFLSMWINPLMDSPSYSPATETVKIVNENVDLMISPSSLIDHNFSI
ncbi:CoxE, partial [Sulfolobus sp. F3]